MARTGTMLNNRFAETKPSKWTDSRLVRECLDGNQDAWSALILRYKNLFFSIPLRYGLSRDEATDIFQTVCTGLISELPRLRKPGALQKWILMVTSHVCYHKKYKDQPIETKAEEISRWFQKALPAEAKEIVQKAEREQAVREAISELPPWDQELIHITFFEKTAHRFEQIAEELGADSDSIGSARRRTLGRLRRKLRGVKVS